MKNARGSASVFLISFFTALVTSVITVLVIYRFVIAPSGGEVSVPNLTGLTQADAQTNLQAKDLAILIGGRKVVKNAPEGTVVSQSPLPGSKVQAGTTVTVTLAGEAPTVPELKGLTIAEATIMLDRGGFKIRTGERVHHASVPKDKIVSQVPPAGTSYEPGRTIIVTVSDGLDLKEVPKLVGTAINRAKQAIKDAGFEVGDVKWGYNEDWGAYIVIKQDPEAGEKAAPGTKIDVVVNEE